MTPDERQKLIWAIYGDDEGIGTESRMEWLSTRTDAELQNIFADLQHPQCDQCGEPKAYARQYGCPVARSDCRAVPEALPDESTHSCLHTDRMLLGDSYEWCGRCGAVRRISQETLHPLMTWRLPTGNLSKP